MLTKFPLKLLYYSPAKIFTRLLIVHTKQSLSLDSRVLVLNSTDLILNFMLYLNAGKILIIRALKLDDWESRQGLGIFLFTTASKPALRGHSASYPMGTRGSFPEGKAAGA
jgi:hypothetical protein